MATPDGDPRPDHNPWLPPEAIPPSSAVPPGSARPPVDAHARVEPTYPPPYPEPRGTDGFAVTGFVLSLLGGMLLAVPFCIYGLHRIKRSGAAGRAMAIAGLVISGLTAALAAVAIVAILLLIPHRDASGEITDGGYTVLAAIRVGDCLTSIDEGQGGFVTVVPCDEPHRAQAVHSLQLTGASYPGAAQTAEDAEERCAEEIPETVVEQIDDETFELMYVYPQATDWNAGDREVLCLVTSPGGPVTGDVVDGQEG